MAIMAVHLCVSFWHIMAQQVGIILWSTPSLYTVEWLFTKQLKHQ